MTSNKDNAVIVGSVENQQEGYVASSTLTLAQPVDGDTITLDGTTFTWRDEADVANDVTIGADAAASAVALAAEENIPTNAVYSVSGNELTITSKEFMDDDVWLMSCDYSTIDSGLNGGSTTPDGDYNIIKNAELDWKPKEVTVESGSTSTALVVNENNPSLVKISVLDDSTNTALKSYNELVENDTVILVNPDNSIDEVVLGETTASDDSSVDTHDIFGDGSCTATYQLNGDATDLGGNYDGDATDITYESGKFGDAGVFNGSSSKIDLGNIDETEMTVSLWVKFNSLEADGQMVFNLKNNYSIQMYEDKRICAFYNDDSHQFESTTDEVETNTWYHVVAVFKSSTESEIFLNSDSQTTTDHEGLLSNNGDCVLGIRGSDWGFDGQIDQVRIFNRALTSDEVEILYNEESTKYTATIDQAETPVAAFKGTSATLENSIPDNSDMILTKSDNTFAVGTIDTMAPHKFVADKTFSRSTDVSSFGLGEAPVKAFFNDTVDVSIAMESTEARTFCTDQTLIKVSATTTEYIGENAISGLLEVGDTVVLDLA